jgi:hypothetical protein
MYWIDSSALIYARRTAYRLEPPESPHGKDFWSFLSKQVTKGEVCAPINVYIDIMDGEPDYLTQWIKGKSGCQVVPPPAVQAHFKTIAKYVQANYKQSKYEEFLNVSDPWVIACAMAVGGTVAAEESRKRKKKIQIPEICDKFEVDYTSLDGMLRSLQAPWLK